MLTKENFKPLLSTLSFSCFEKQINELQNAVIFFQVKKGKHRYVVQNFLCSFGFLILGENI